MGRMAYRVSRKFGKEVSKAAGRAARQRERELKQEKKRKAKEIERQRQADNYEQFTATINQMQNLHNNKVNGVDWKQISSLIQKKEEKYQQAIATYKTPAYMKLFKLGKQHENRAMKTFAQNRLLTLDEILGDTKNTRQQMDMEHVKYLIEGVQKLEKDLMIEFYQLFCVDEKSKYGISKWDYQFIGELFYVRGFYSLKDYPERKRIRLDSGKIGNRKMSISDRNKLIRSHVRSASLWKGKSVFSLLPIKELVVEILEIDDDGDHVVSSLYMDKKLFKSASLRASCERFVESWNFFEDNFRVGDGYKAIPGYFEQLVSDNGGRR